MSARDIDINVSFNIKEGPLDQLNKKIDKMVGKSTGNLGKVEKNVNKAATSFNKITTGVNKVTTKLNKMSSVGTKIARPFVNSFNKIRNGISNTTSKIKTYTSNIKKAITSSSTFNKVSTVFNKTKGVISKMTAPLQKLPSLFKKAGTEGHNAGSRGKTGMNNLTSSIFKANAALSILQAGFQKIISSIGQMINTTDTWTNTTARLDLINDGRQSTPELRQKVLGAATRSRGDYTAMADTTAKLGLLAGDNFKSNDELVKFSELMQKSFVVSGAGTAEQEAGMYQLTQAMAAGKLQGDEFRSIMENAPMLADAIAKYTGKTKGELKEMSSEGLITADIIKAALFSAGDDINKKFETMPRTFSSVWTDIKNSALFAFSDIMEGMNKFLNSESGIKIVDGIKKSFEKLSKVVTKVFNWMADHADIVKAALAGIATVITAKLIASFAQLAISLATNPVTWIAVAIFAIGAGLYYAYKKCEPFRNAVNTLGDAIKAVFGDENSFNKIKEQFPQLIPIIDTFRVAIDKVKEALEILGLRLQALFGDEDAFSKLQEKCPLVAAEVTILRDAFDGVRKGVKFLWDTFKWFMEWVQESGLIEFFAIIGDTLKTSILNTFKKIHETYVTYVQPAIDNFIEGFNKLRDKFVEVWDKHIKPILDEWGPKFQTMWVEHVQPFINKLVEGFGRIINALSQLWNEFLVPIFNWIMENIIPKLVPVFEFLGNTVRNIFSTMCDVVGGLWDVLVGLIDFIVGVFTGDWERAWEGIKTIFSGIWDSLKGIAAGAMNSVIHLVNLAIGQLNKINVKVPDYVPKYGGKEFGFNIPTLDEVSFEKGTKGAYNTPETFIAGENGPELITGAKNKRVYPANETDDMLGKGNNVFNITINVDGSKGSQETAKSIREELEDFFASFNRRNPRSIEV